MRTTTQAVICLTASIQPRSYSLPHTNVYCDSNGMSNKCKEAESPAIALKDESARQRWELFHRAIAHAKQTNDDALAEADDGIADGGAAGPALTIVR